jgi:hypothetical protein
MPIIVASGATPAAYKLRLLLLLVQDKVMQYLLQQVLQDELQG